MNLNLIFTTLFIVFSNFIFGQSNFSDNPLDAVFETKDSKNFWEAFDKMEKSKHRPNDLGYWIGYKITEAYFNKQKDKQKAIDEIINIKDPMQFLKQSGFLDVYIEKYQKSKKESYDEFF